MAKRNLAVSKNTESEMGMKAVRQQTGPNIERSLNTTADHILSLQKTAGNQAVESLFRSGAIQAKLEVGRPDDIYEQEADMVADQVMRMPEHLLQPKNSCESLTSQYKGNEPAHTESVEITPPLQRQTVDEEDDTAVRTGASSGEIANIVKSRGLLSLYSSSGFRPSETILNKTKKDKKKRGKKIGATGTKTKPAKILFSSALITKMTATVLAEAYEGQEEKIGWIYYNNLLKKKEAGLRVSTAFKEKQDWYKVWMVALDDKTYAKDKPRPKTKELKGYKSIADFVEHNGWMRGYGKRRAKKAQQIISMILKDPSKNPYPGWLGQGNLDDFNRGDDTWKLPRLYYQLQRENKDMKILVVELPASSKENTSFIFDRDEIIRFFKDNPNLLQKNVEKYDP